MSIYKNIVLTFSLLKTVFFFLFCFAICKMIDNEYSMDICKCVKKKSIGAVLKHPEILKFVPEL